MHPILDLEWEHYRPKVVSFLDIQLCNYYRMVQPEVCRNTGPRDNWKSIVHATSQCSGAIIPSITDTPHAAICSMVEYQIRVAAFLHKLSVLSFVAMSTKRAHSWSATV